MERIPDRGVTRRDIVAGLWGLSAIASSFSLVQSYRTLEIHGTRQRFVGVSGPTSEEVAREANKREAQRVSREVFGSAQKALAYLVLGSISAVGVYFLDSTDDRTHNY